MDYETYKFLRAYCWQELSPYFNTPRFRAAVDLSCRMGGHAEVLKHEQELAKSFYECSDLTARETAAAHLWEVISNAHAITYQRDANLVKNPAPPLEKLQAEALLQQIKTAIAKCDFIPNKEIFIAEAEETVNAMIPQSDITTSAIILAEPSKVSKNTITKTEPSESKQTVIALLDDCVSGYNLVRNLGWPPDWMKNCAVGPPPRRGRKGARRWNLAMLADALVRRGYASKVCITGKLKSKPDWLEEFKKLQSNDLP